MGIYVVGMHRSGTSALSRFVGLLVGFTGVKGAATDNAEGHWEDPRVNRALESAFRARGYDWASPPLVPLRWELADAEARASMTAVLKALDGRPWVIKDPRLCIALEATLDLDLKDPAVIATYREPAEVALSIADRDGYEYEYGLALWELYTRLMVEQIQRRAQDACWVSYDALMADPTTVGLKLARFLTEHGYPTRDGRVHEATRAINPARRHHHMTAPDRSELSSSQLELLEMVEAAVVTGSIGPQAPPPLTGWARALLETRRSYQRIERDNRLLVHRLNRVRPLYQAFDYVRKLSGRPVPEDPFALSATSTRGTWSAGS